MILPPQTIGKLNEVPTISVKYLPKLLIGVASELPLPEVHKILLLLLAWLPSRTKYGSITEKTTHILTSGHKEIKLETSIFAG